MIQNRKSRIFYLWDEAKSAKEWGRCFEKTAEKRGDLEIIKINQFSGSDWPALLQFLTKEVGSGDLLLARPKDNADTKVPISKENFQTLESVFRPQKIFPRANLYQFFDDKKKQCEFLKAHHFPIPKTAWVTNQVELKQFMAEEGLFFPLVRKDSQGHDGLGVSLILDLTQMHYPGLLQEFCTGFKGEIRVVCIGSHVTGYLRKCHPFDFKASGSGLKESLQAIPNEICDITRRLFLDTGFYSGCVDFIKNHEGHWVISEFSYLWPLRNLVFLKKFWNLFDQSEHSIGLDWMPSDWILEDMIPI